MRIDLVGSVASMTGSVDPDRTEWEVIVIGGGPPGENVAAYASDGSGLSAVIVEQELVGGECSYWACMPSKALLRPVEVLDTARKLPGARQALEGRTVDVAAVLARRDAFTSHHDDSSQVQWANGAGIDIVRGRGRLTDDRTVEVTLPAGETRTLTARHAVVLATGTRASVPPIDGLREALPWTSRDVTNLHEVPRRVVVIGGGVVACESVTWLHGLGSEQLTVVEGSQRLLGRTEPFAGELVAEQFGKAGIDVRLGARAASVRREGPRDTGEGYVHGGEVTLTLEDGTSVTADEIVVAAGRTPNSDDLGLDTVGVAAGEHGFLDVDDHLSVTGSHWLPVTLRWSSTSRKPCSPAATPTVSRPRSSLLGVRPAATTISSAVTDVPSSSVTVTSPPCTCPSPVSRGPSRRTDAARAPSRTSIPALPNCSATSSPANGSVRPRSRCDPSMTVSCSEPSPCSHVTDSHATTPPPITTTRRGTSCRLVTSRDVHGSASRSPSIGGTDARVPVASTTACRAVSVRVSPAGSVTWTVLSPVSRSRPRTMSMPAS